MNIIRTIAWRIISAAFLTGALALGTQLAAPVIDVAQPSHSKRGHDESVHAANIAANHNCWTFAEGGQHPFPTHSILTLKGEQHPAYMGQTSTNAALFKISHPNGDGIIGTSKMEAAANAIETIWRFCE